MLVLFTALVVFEYTKPKEIDWSLSLKKEDKIPFGSYIFFDLMEDIFADSEVKTNDISPFKALKNKDLKNTSYIVITPHFAPIEVNQTAFFDFVKRGNKMFVSSLDFGTQFMDSLDFSTKTFLNILKKDSLKFNFFNKNLETDSGYNIKSLTLIPYIDSLNVKNSTKIAYFDNKKTVFCRIKYGKGEFLIDLQPFAYTNYNLLNKNGLQYALKSLSFAKNKTVIWDEYYAYNKYNRSAMSYILSQSALRAAWQLLLILTVVYLVFGSKRKQRIMPVMSKPANSSLDFAKTLANLYLSNKNNKDIAEKKFSFWLNYLRKHYFLKIEQHQKLDISLISEKTGVEELVISKIIKTKQKINSKNSISANDLLNFNQIIDEFYQQIKTKTT